jgi:hypothetical protein
VRTVGRSRRSTRPTRRRVVARRALATVDDLKTPRAMSYVRVKRKRGDASHARVVVEVVEAHDGFGDGARGANAARAAALARALDDALDGALDATSEARGARKRRRRARRVAEGVARDDAETRAADDGAGRETRVYDAMVDSLERARAMESALMCNYAPMVREYLASRGEANAEAGPPPFEGEEAFARTSTSASEGEDEWVYDVYEMMDEDARDSDDDDFDDGYAPVIRVRDFHDVADDEDAESDYGDSDSNAAGYFDDYPDTESDSSEHSDRFEDDDSGFGDDDDDDWS